MHDEPTFHHHRLAFWRSWDPSPTAANTKQLGGQIWKPGNKLQPWMKTLVCGSTELHAETGLRPRAESIGQHWGCWKNSKSPCLHFPGTKSLIILVFDIVWCSCCLMVGHLIHKSFKIIRILEVNISFGMGFARGIPWLKHRSNTWIYSSWSFSAKPPQMIYVREVLLGSERSLQQIILLQQRQQAT